MEVNPETCSTETEGLILSSFEVLQDSNPQQSEGRQQLKLSSPFLNEPGTGAHGEHDEVANQPHNEVLTPHPCDTDTAEGDEMFDVADTDQFRGDEAGDSLDNDTNNNSLEREDEGDDEEDEEDEDEEEDEDVVIRREGIQGLPATSQEASVDGGVKNLACTPSVAELRPLRHQQEDYVELTSGLAPHGFMDSSRVWHSDPATPNSCTRFPADWHIPLSSTSGVTTREVLSESPSPGEGRDGNGGDKHWKFVHGHHHPTGQHHRWGVEQSTAKVVVAPANPAKHELVEEHPHDLHHLDSTGHWGQHVRPGQAALHGTAVHGWHKDMGGVLTQESDMGAVRKLYNLQPSQGGITTPPASNSFTDMPCASTGTWNLGAHLPAGQNVGPLPRPVLHHDLTCCRTAPATYYHQAPAQSYAGFQGQAREGWRPAALSPTLTTISADSTGEHFKVGGVQPSILCKSAILNKRGKGRTTKCVTVSPTETLNKTRPALDQVRQQTHPYQMKEQKKVVRDVYPATSANVHTLKASHIVSWYIDYLIHENEHLTQISRAFSLPVNLFHSDDFYFMDSLKKKVHFPSLKFLSWMQQNLPSINVNAIDFHEGRPPMVSTWNQDWFWQNKSRRDIIHDVFFYFQHRRVTCEN